MPAKPEFSQFLRFPLAIDTRALESIQHDASQAQENGPDFSAGFEVSHDRYGNAIAQPYMVNGTAVIPLIGTMSNGLGPLGEYYGYADISKFRERVAAAAADPAVSKIAINVNSPGGSVLGTRDAAEVVAKAAESKPLMAYASGLMASASYYAVAGANAIYTGSSAIVGSIGVITMVVDASEFYEGVGYKLHVMRSGDKKALGAYGVDKMDEAKLASVQSDIDALGGEFRQFVQSFRSVSDEDLQGQTFSGIQAVERGFAHGIANSFEEALSRFSSINQ